MTRRFQDCTDRDHEGNLPFHAWYTAYAPYEDPEIVVTVFVYSGGEGSTVAIPVAQETLHACFMNCVNSSTADLDTVSVSRDFRHQFSVSAIWFILFPATAYQVMPARNE